MPVWVFRLAVPAHASGLLGLLCCMPVQYVHVHYIACSEHVSTISIDDGFVGHMGAMMATQVSMRLHALHSGIRCRSEVKVGPGGCVVPAIHKACHIVRFLAGRYVLRVLQFAICVAFIHQRTFYHREDCCVQGARQRPHPHCWGLTFVIQPPRSDALQM